MATKENNTWDANLESLVLYFPQCSTPKVGPTDLTLGWNSPPIYISSNYIHRCILHIVPPQMTWTLTIK